LNKVHLDANLCTLIFVHTFQGQPSSHNMEAEMATIHIIQMNDLYGFHLLVASIIKENIWAHPLFQSRPWTHARLVMDLFILQVPMNSHSAVT